MLDKWHPLPGTNASFLLTSERHVFEGCIAACAALAEGANATLACIDSAEKAAFVGEGLLEPNDRLTLRMAWFGLFQHPHKPGSPRAGWQPTAEGCGSDFHNWADGRRAVAPVAATCTTGWFAGGDNFCGSLHLHEMGEWHAGPCSVLPMPCVCEQPATLSPRFAAEFAESAAQAAAIDRAYLGIYLGVCAGVTLALVGAYAGWIWRQQRQHLRQTVGEGLQRAKTLQHAKAAQRRLRTRVQGLLLVLGLVLVLCGVAPVAFYWFGVWPEALARSHLYYACIFIPGIFLCLQVLRPTDGIAIRVVSLILSVLWLGFSLFSLTEALRGVSHLTDTGALLVRAYSGSVWALFFIGAAFLLRIGCPYRRLGALEPRRALRWLHNVVRIVDFGWVAVSPSLIVFWYLIGSTLVPYVLFFAVILLCALADTPRCRAAGE